MSDSVVKIIIDLALPPSGPIILIALGMLLWLFRLPILAAIIILISTVVLYFSSTPFIAQKLLDTLQYQHPVLKEVPKETQAIVVLGAGRLPICT